MSARDHAAYQDEVGAYLLGALTDLEVQAFERHMAHCPSCRDEVERLRPASDALPRSVEQLAPSPSLKTGLMEIVDREAEERAAESAEPVRPRKRGFGQRIRSVLPPLRPVLVAGAVLLAAAGGFFGARLLEEPETRTLAATVDERRIPEASGRLVLQGNGEDGGILRLRGMPALQPNQVYQAWVAREGTFDPQPTFEVGATGGGAVAIPDDLSDAQQVLVTREARGGARAPGEAPIVAVRLQ
jgi:hypothetical protein